MNENKKLLDIKAKVMLQRIEKLCGLFKMIFQEGNCLEISSLELIKSKYIQMYNQIIEKKEYEKYKEVEDIIIKEISKIELKLDEYILSSVQHSNEIVKRNADKIRNSENYRNYQNLSEEVNRINSLRKLLKLYEPYLDKSKEEKIKYEISHLRFDLLYRKQVEELIYGNGRNDNNLKLYENEQEKEIFERLLQEKINKIRSIPKDGAINNDKLFDISTEQILNDSNLLERLIILDMKTRPFDYINLVKAKIFNAHLCNIGNNPFEEEIYLTTEQLHKLGYNNYDTFWGPNGEKFEGLKANKVNYSLLEAILKNIITDENISIIECENLYKRFGFECRPILTNIGQQCVYMVFNDVAKSQKLNSIKETIKKDKQNEKGQYCKIIDFEGLIYKFYPKEEDSNDVLEQILDRRPLIQQESEIKKKKFFFLKKETTGQERSEQGDLLQEVKEKVKKTGFITTDLDVIILLIKDIIDTYIDEAKELEKRYEEENKDKSEYDYEPYRIRECRRKISFRNKQIEWLENLKNRKLTLKEKRKLLLVINDVYRELTIKYDVRKVIPLENMGTQNSDQVYLAPIPEESGTYSVEVSHCFSRGSTYENRSYYKSDSEPLWKKYQKEFKDLGIDVKKSRSYRARSRFDICINLDDISDLPIDYDKVQLLTKEELQKIIEREEGNERE